MRSHFMTSFLTVTLGLPTFIGHTFLTLTLLIALSLSYQKITNFNFINLIKNNNKSSAIAFGGIFTSFAIPLATCLAGSLHAVDILVWALPLGIF